MRFKCAEDGQLVSIDLSREELYELLAFEANCAQLVPEKDQELLEAIRRQYRLSREELAPFLDKPRLTRDDVWGLQALKRRSQGNASAAEAVRQLQALEVKLGATLLRSLIERSRLEGPAWK